MSQHIVLLGDSVFDNRSYTGDQPDVVEHLRDLLPTPWLATLCAVDGSVAMEVPAQLERLPDDASHLVVSMGGNDALLNADVLGLPVTSTAQALEIFGGRVERFEASYASAVDALLERGLPVTVCTVYNGNLEDPREAEAARIALMLFNDVILRVAFRRFLPVIDLRFVCSEPGDFANPIEPSSAGGRKIAGAITRAVGVRGPDPTSPVFTAN